MNALNLDRLCNPKSLAMIDASANPRKWGFIIMGSSSSKTNLQAKMPPMMPLHGNISMFFKAELRRSTPAFALTASACVQTTARQVGAVCPAIHPCSKTCRRAQVEPLQGILAKSNEHLTATWNAKSVSRNSIRETTRIEK